MPAIWEISGKALSGYRGPNGFGPLIYRWVRTGLQLPEVDSQPGASVAPLQPFTVSPLYLAHTSGFDTHLAVEVGDRIAFRVSTLNPETDVAASSWTDTLPNASLEFDALAVCDLQIERIHQTSYDQLWAQALQEGPSVIRFRFRTPTVFREHRQLMPFPLPSLVFHTLGEKWRRWSPVDLRGVDEWVASSVFLTGYRLRTRRLMGHRATYPGFVGDAWFSLRRLDALQIPAIRALALYAQWAGVGAMTTVGFGQVEVSLDYPEPHAEQ